MNQKHEEKINAGLLQIQWIIYIYIYIYIYITLSVYTEYLQKYKPLSLSLSLSLSLCLFKVSQKCKPPKTLLIIAYEFLLVINSKTPKNSTLLLEIKDWLDHLNDMSTHRGYFMFWSWRNACIVCLNLHLFYICFFRVFWGVVFFLLCLVLFCFFVFLFWVGIVCLFVCFIFVFFFCSFTFARGSDINYSNVTKTATFHAWLFPFSRKISTLRLILTFLIRKDFVTCFSTNFPFNFKK